MEYVEFLRVRRVLTIFATFVAVIAILAIATIIYSSIATTGKDTLVGVSIGDKSPMESHKLSPYLQALPIPLGLLIAIASYVAIVVATVFASSLNKENDGLDFVFVKPIRREIIAMRYFATDIVGILAIFAFTIAAEFISLALSHLSHRISIDARAFWVGGLGLGVAFMWYGILQAVTATYKGKGGMIVGFSWAIFGVLTGAGSLTVLGPIYLGIVHTMNFANPLAYLSSLASNGSTNNVGSVLGGSLEAHACIVWVIALGAMAIAAISWKRVEV